MAVLQTLLTLGCFCLIQAEYYISSATYDRENASDICRLATPNIRFSEDGNKVLLKTPHIPDGEKLWIGYALELTTFLYIGCSQADDLTDNARTSIIYQKDPGQCYSLCKTTFFGMQESNCYCIYSPPINLGTKECISTCDNPYDTLCGQTGNINAVSVYMTVNDTTDKDSNGYFCQAVQRSSKESNFSWNYVWEACDTSLQFICQNGTFSESSQQFYWSIARQTWKESMTSCIFDDQHTAQNIDSMVEAKTDTNKRWIGKIRSFVIQNTTDESNVNHLDVRQGYIERDNETVHLKFDSSSEDSLHALCNQEHGTTLTFSSTTKSTGSSTGGNDFPWVAVGIAVGIGIGGLLVIILVIYFCRKRLLWRCCKRKHKESREIDTTNAVDNMLYSEVQQKSMSVVDDAQINATVNDENDTTTNIHSNANVT